MEPTNKLRAGMVVQLGPAAGEFAYCFMTVTEPKSFGAQGYVQNAGAKGQAYFRANFKDMEIIGESIWMVGADSSEIKEDE
jgi:hypothetical protein